MKPFIPLALLLVSGCGQSAVPASPLTAPVVKTPRDSLAAVVEPAMASVQVSTASAAVPAIVAVREAVQAAVPPARTEPPSVSPAAVALIVRWEVSGESYYNKRLRSPIWPGGASGVTWGIGYDGGHQTRQQIAVDWSAHAAVARLQATAGTTGATAKQVAAQLADVRTAYDYASDVFGGVSLPAYRVTTRRAFGEPFDALPWDAQGALVSVVYNRGGSMLGAKRTEMRAIRDECLPQGDVACVGAQIRAMCRLWVGTELEEGLCGRRRDEARLAEAAR